jgi:hypothetical protein
MANAINKRLVLGERNVTGACANRQLFAGGRHQGRRLEGGRGGHRQSD